MEETKESVESLKDEKMKFLLYNVFKEDALKIKCILKRILRELRSNFPC